MIISRICRVFDKSICPFKFCLQTPKFKFSTIKIDLPEPPKRPLTAYLIFCKESRPGVLKDNPSLKTPQLVKLLAEKWVNLNPDLKKEYEDSAREGLISYSRAHKDYYESLTDQQKMLLSKMKEDKRISLKKLRLKRALKESGLPSSPSTAYIIYLQSKVKDRKSSMRLADFSKEVAEIWRNMTDEEKLPYVKKAELSKKEYDMKMRNWREKLIENGQEDLIKAFEELKLRKKNSKNDELKFGTKELKIK